MGDPETVSQNKILRGLSPLEVLKLLLAVEPLIKWKLTRKPNYKTGECGLALAEVGEGALKLLPLEGSPLSPAFPPTRLGGSAEHSGTLLILLSAPPN